MVPYVEKYMAALDGAMLANSPGGDVQAALTTYDTSKQNLQRELADTDVVPDVRTGVTNRFELEVRVPYVGRHDQVTTLPGFGHNAHVQDPTALTSALDDVDG